MQGMQSWESNKDGMWKCRKESVKNDKKKERKGTERTMTSEGQSEGEDKYIWDVVWESGMWWDDEREAGR